MNDDHDLSFQIEQIQQKLSLTRLEFTSRLDKLQNQLDDLNVQRQQASTEQPSATKQPNASTVDVSNLTQSEPDAILEKPQTPDHALSAQTTDQTTDQTTIEPKAPSLEHPQTQQTSQSAKTALSDSNQRNQDQTTQHTPDKSPIKKSDTFIEKMGHSLIAQLISLFNLVSAPVLEVFNKIISMYGFYQKQGKAPVFLMTVAGIITLTFGFGYLLQFAFYTIFNDTLKAITGFVIGGTLSGVGIYLSVKKSEFSEYAASVIALGIIFNYLTAYFIGPYYQIVSPIVSFILLLFITSYSTLLAKIFETKVVAAITLIGGVFMPVISGQGNESSWVYFVYLFILMFVNLYLAISIKWPALGKLTFVLSLSMLQYLNLSAQVSPLLAVFFLCISFMAFVYYFSFDGFQLKDKLDRKTLTLLVANLFYFIYAMFSIEQSLWLVATGFAVVLGLLIGAVRLLSILKSNIAPMFVLFIALISACIIFVLAPVELNTILWIIEALILIFIGFKYQHPLIRSEGYLLFIYAMGSLFWMSLGLLDNNVDLYFLLSLGLFTLFNYAIYKLVAHYSITSSKIENIIKQFGIELYAIFSVILTCFAIEYCLPKLELWLFIPIILSFFNLISFSLKTGPIVLISLMVALVLNVLASATSSIYTQQSMHTWILSIEVLLSLWVAQHVYIKYQIKSWSNDLALFMQYFVYCIPVILTLFSAINIINGHASVQHWTGDINQLNTAPLNSGSLISYLWFDLLVIGASFALLYASLLIPVHKLMRALVLKQRYILNESLSVFASLFVLYTSYLLIGAWTFALLPLIICAMCYRALKYNLLISEKLAWTHFIAYALMVLYGYTQTSSFHFTDQPLVVMIGYVELLLNAWFMLSIYQHLNFKTSGYAFSKFVRLCIYIVLPLLFLGRIARLYLEFLPVALFASFFMSWCLHHILNYKALLIESKILFYCALLATLSISALAITGTAQLPGLIAIMSGLLIISIIHWFEGSLNIAKQSISRYKIQIQQTPYFYIFALFALSFAVLEQLTLSLALSVVALYGTLISQTIKHIMRASFTFAYFLMVICVATILANSLSQTDAIANTLHSLYMAVALLVVLSIGYLVCFTHHPVLMSLNNNVTSKVHFYWIYHILMTLSYVAFSNYVLTDWSILISILLLLHALFILFLTLKQQYKSLIKLSLILYVLTACKVLIYDLAGSSNIEKIIALMVMGSILMLGAYGFQKYRAKYEIEATPPII